MFEKLFITYLSIQLKSFAFLIFSSQAPDVIVFSKSLMLLQIGHANINLHDASPLLHFHTCFNISNRLKSANTLYIQEQKGMFAAISSGFKLSPANQNYVCH